MTRPIHRFGEYRIDPSARELHRGSELAVLSPKVFDCLAYLIEHRDRAIGRDELIAAVWGKVDVSDTLLGQTVLKARRAIGDTGNEQRAIRTIPRFGYRWVADVSLDDVATEPVVSAIAPAPPVAALPVDAALPAQSAATESVESQPIVVAASRRDGKPRPAILLGAAIVIAAALAAAGWQFAHRASTAGATAPMPSAPAVLDATAVLPVEVSGDGEWSWLRLGLMDLIATRMRSAGIAVVPSDNIVALLRNGDNDSTAAKSIADSTGARYVVRPAATRSAADWRVRLSLRAADGSEREVEARNADVIAAGRAAADRLLDLLGKHAPGADETHDLSAAELISRAEAALLADDLASARRLLETAPTEVRQSPELRLRLAQIDFRAGQLHSARTRLDQLLTEVGAEANPVLRARILNGLGAVDIRDDRNAEGEHDFGEAIALLEKARGQPAALGQAYTGRGISFASRTRFDLAAADFSRARVALELAGDMLALGRVEANEAIVDAKRGRYAEALAGHQHAAQRFERFGAANELVTTLANAANAQLMLLRPADALATSARAWPLPNRLESQLAIDSYRSERADILFANGRLGDARALLRELTATLSHERDLDLLARVQTTQARLALLDDQAETAATLAASAVAALATPDYLRERASAWLLLTRALRAQGKDTEAAAETARLTAWAADAQYEPAHVFATLAQAEQAWGARQIENARAAYERALALAELSAVPADTAEVVISFGSTLIAEGELERASAVVGQAARWAEQDFGSALLQVKLYHALKQTDAWRSALARARGLAGERVIAARLTESPNASGQASAAARSP
jgi:DNA-binding winged helix-turn-helix (wHTH) protein/TolB-like protein